MRDDTRRWIEADKASCWHPFTRQAEWCAPDSEPLVITRGDGVWLHDSEGRRYIDGNSSIWTNIHGHAHPHITEAIRRQAGEICHSSFLGFTHPGATGLAEKLCGFFPTGTLDRAFFSDDGSTAIECALKMSLQYHRQNGWPERDTFIAFANGYHGDTLGAASLGGVRRFKGSTASSKVLHRNGFPALHLTGLGELPELSRETLSTIAGVVIEPLIQGVNEMRPWPDGMLAELRTWCDGHGIHLILDEVMTGFGRTGTLFACQQEEVIPDFLCLAKGLTGGYLPMAATLVTTRVYDGFLGGSDRAFYYGHSYTANPLGCAAALASLEIFEQEETLANLPPKVARLAEGLETLQTRHPVVHQIRQRGLIAGIELRQPDGTKFHSDARVGETTCLAARRHGLLTRPILDTVVLMPPLSITLHELDLAIAALDSTLSENF